MAEPEGGGFKLKCLDYVFNRVPMAVLEGSAAGLPLEPGEAYLRFDGMDALADGVLGVLDDLPRLNDLQERAYRSAEAAFDWEARGRALRDALAELRPASSSSSPSARFGRLRSFRRVS